MTTFAWPTFVAVFLVVNFDVLVLRVGRIASLAPYNWGFSIQSVLHNEIKLVKKLV